VGLALQEHLEQVDAGRADAHPGGEPDFLGADVFDELGLVGAAVGRPAGEHFEEHRAG
jgi:hypothetical protein